METSAGNARPGPRGDGVGLAGTAPTQQEEITRERQELLDEVERRAAELDATIASIADGLVIYDTEGRIMRMNAAAEQLLGYPAAGPRRKIAEQLEALRCELPTGQRLGLEESPPVRALHGETVRGAVVILHHPDGRTVWVSSSAAPVRTADGELLGAVMTFTDITPLHELQEQREDLLRAVSHDLRNPLTVIRTRAELLLRLQASAGASPEEKESAEAILASARHMNAMIQELVDATRLEAGQVHLELQPVDLATFLNGLVARLSGALDTRRIRVSAPPGLPPALADPDQLERIVTNLLSNALKYSPAGSEVTVTLSARDGQLVTAVADRGPGIAPEDLPHLFERYYRTAAVRERHEGLGLGLYITRKLVEAHGGRIWVESEPGKGSTFYFSLPRAG